MTIQSRLARSTYFAALLLALAQPAGAQASARKALPSNKPPVARASQNELHPEPADKDESRQSPAAPEDQMRQTLDRLVTELKSLAAEVQRLRRATDRNAQNMELLLSEERLARFEDRLQEATDRKPLLDAREQDLQRRMKNIPNELLMRGGMRREEAEAAAKADLQKALDEVHGQQTVNQARIVEYTKQAERLRIRVEALRSKVDPPETEK
ncbi:MAG TPA: hypothetical protein VFB82_06005 [Blastocatellia bacterium]|nr:hypothetical protein [Blastocatellia bacterium]